MKFKCERCGKKYDYMPEGKLCHECGGRVGVVMDVIGFIRDSSEEGSLYLFQCPKCKSVVISNKDEICFCEEVID